MFTDFLKNHIKSQASYVEFGFGQVEPNHLSARKTGQIYAQLPAAKDIEVLEQGQFVKYDYANGVVNFEGAGEWMLVYNEIKLYREHQWDCEFAMLKDNYQARVYSPVAADTNWDKQSRYYNGVDADGNDSITLGENTYAFDDVTAAPDMYEPYYNEDPFHIESLTKEQMMPEGTTMVPRVFKTNVGDIMTTNTINAETLEVGQILTPGATGILEVGEGDMKWQVVKVYTMPDHQKGVKIMRIA
ncbi:MAG: hypothetical protein E7167_01610 [Firmicutes bacterium]|nr:hypothetical protein [Bacillota bacterium]